uniref:DUF3363 domain-containing protein n=1 Tax=Novacetimonas hansenii TaxID=436 RepID=UPI0015B82A55
MTFHNAENGFCVLRVKVRGQRDLVTVVGHAAMISAGEFVQMSGRWFNDHTHGLQFKAEFLKASPPTTVEGIERYLGSGMIRGIGPVYAKKLVKAFGEAVFDLIEQEPGRLREVTGIGPKRAERIVAGWADQKVIREIMLFLHSNGVGTSRAVRIFKTYGQDAVKLISENPYADRWTQLDRQLQRDAGEDGVIALGRASDEKPDAFATVKLGRLRRLETMGLAHQVGPDRWRMDESAEATLREISERNDIIKRIHRGLAEQKIDRAVSSWVLAGEDTTDPVIGRLVDRGLDDELRGTAYAVIDGIDGRMHHVRLPHLEAAGDGAVGSIVELRRFTDKEGRNRVALAVRSDVTLERQVTAEGATWLDRQAIAREPLVLASTGFGAEVKEAMEKRTEHLVEQGLASRDGGGIRYARNLIATLRQRELNVLGRSLAGKSGMPFRRSGEGDPVTGTYRQRFNLASGRFAMIDDGLGFELVPWSPSLEKQRGREVSGIMRGDGGIDWSFARKRGLGL